VASHKSAVKRIRQTRQRTAQNRTHQTRLRHQIRKLRMALDAKDPAQAKAVLLPTLSLIDHMMRKRILHRNTAARYKSRLTLRVNALAKA
jgi:small subunit ribosomal protein S20